MHEADSSAQDLFADKVSRGIFNPVARHLREDLRDDRLAEGVAQVYEMFARKAERGIEVSDAILVHACHLRAGDLGRHLARGTHSKRDALDERNYTGGHVEVLHLGLDGDDASLGYAAPLTNNPTTNILSALSLERWLSELSPRDRLMLALRQAGHTLAEIALELGVSTSAVFSRLKVLGRQLEAHVRGSAP